MNHTPEKRIHFIRHGVAYHNVAAAIHGPRIYRDEQFLDARLTEDGRVQAQQLGDRVRAHIRPDLIIVSPLTRAIETALLMQLSSGASIMCLEICREANGVNYCDKRRTRDELSKEFPSVDFAGLVENEDVHFNPVKRETIAEVVQRAEKFVDFILKRREETIVVVSHGVFLEVLLRHTVLAEFDHLYRSDLRGMPLSNCEVRSVSVCESHGGIAGEAGTCNSNMDTE